MVMAQHLYSSNRSKTDPGNGDKAQVEHEPVDRVLPHPEPATIGLPHGTLHLWKRSSLLSLVEPGRNWPGPFVQNSMAGAAGTGSAFFGFSATSASVVISSDATDAASCKAVRTTLAGSITPAFTKSSYSPVAALKPQL